MSATSRKCPFCFVRNKRDVPNCSSYSVYLAGNLDAAIWPVRSFWVDDDHSGCDDFEVGESVNE